MSARKAKRSQKAQPAPCDHSGLICQLDRVNGAVLLARAAVFAEAGVNEELTGAWQVLDLATDRIQDIRRELEGVQS